LITAKPRPDNKPAPEPEKKTSGGEKKKKKASAK
jgi:hypothetical protein